VPDGPESFMIELDIDTVGSDMERERHCAVRLSHPDHNIINLGVDSSQKTKQGSPAIADNLCTMFHIVSVHKLFNY